MLDIWLDTLEKGDLAPLVEAPYGGLEEEISSILENRALAVSGTIPILATRWRP